MKSFEQARSARKRSRWPVWVALIVLLAGGGGAAWYFLLGPGSARAQARPAAGSETYTFAVERGDLSISAAGSGKLVAYQTVDLNFSTSGTVSELNVQVGDMVKAGQVLASLGSSATLEANVSAAKLQVLQAEKALADLKQNAAVALAQANSDLVAAQETYAAALTKSQRLAYARCGQDTATRLSAALEQAGKKLASIHAETVGSDVYIAAKKAYDTAQANYNACGAYTTSEKNSTASELEVATAALQEAQDTLGTLNANEGIDPAERAMDGARLKEAQARLANAEDQLAGITLTAPLDGKITYLAAQAGKQVGTATYITIVDVSHATLEISVDESDFNRLVVGSRVDVAFDALDDMAFTGRIVQVDPQVTNSGQYRVAKAVVEMDDGANTAALKTLETLPLGLSASVTVVNSEVKNVLLVPVVSLKDLGNGTFAVMVRDSDGQMRTRAVTVGIQNNDYVEILTGLEAGEQVSTGTIRFMAAGSSTSSNSLKNAENSGGFPGGGPPMP
jgi:HlyD family secretion protein